MALRELQATKDGALSGNRGRMKSKNLTTVTQRSGKIQWKDFTSQVPEREIKIADKSTNTDVSLPPKQAANKKDSVRESLVAINPNSAYLELVAEERRKALAEALEENRELVKKIEALEEENRKLRELAEEGMEYARILKGAMDSGLGDDLESSSLTE